MSDTLLIIRKGVFAPQEITVPFGRIQDVYVDQDIFDRLLGIYDVHISTATAASTVRAHIDGVDKKVAEELRTLILDKVHHKGF
jgi:membrane protein YdbS with pleckstrin-like domain